MKKKIFFIIVGILIIFIGVGIFFYKNLTNNNQSEKIMLYVNNDKELKYITSSTNNSIVLSKLFDENINAKFNNNKFLYLNEKDLYYVDIQNNKNDKIGTNVNDYGFIDDNIYYLDAQNSLYYVKNGNKQQIDININTINYTNNNIFLYTKDNNLYYYNINTNSKAIIVKDCKNLSKIYFDNNNENILFLSSNTIYFYNLKDTKITNTIENVDEILDVNNNLDKIIYKTLKESKSYYNAFIDDDMKDKDNTAPSSCYYYYDEFYDKYYYYDDNFVIHFTTKEEYDLCNSRAKGYSVRNQIRGDADEVLNYYDVYLYNGQNAELIDSNVNDVLFANASENKIIVQKLVVNENEKVKISTINSYEDYQDIIAKYKYLITFNKDTTITELENNSTINNVNIINNNIYYSIDYGLFIFNIKTNNKEKLGENVSVIDMNKKYYDVLYIDDINENNQGTLKYYINDNSESIDNSVYIIATADNDDIYYYKNYNQNTYSGDYINYNLNTKKSYTLEDIMFAKSIKDNNMFVFKDYSVSSKSASLFKYNNGKYEPIEYNIVDFITN